MSARFPNGDPHAVARAILADPRFRGTTTSNVDGPDPLTQLLTWIGERLRDLMDSIKHLLGADASVNGTLALIVLGIVVAALSFLFVRFLMLPGRRYRSNRSTVTALDADLSSAALIALALAAAREERWHDAASALVRAAMRALDERGRLRFDAARTPGEARRSLRDASFDAFEREAMTALFAAGAATADRFARMQAAYAATFAEPPA